MSVKKFAGVTILAAAGSVAAAPFYAVGVVLSDVVRFMYRHPRTTAATMLAAGWLWYHSADSQKGTNTRSGIAEIVSSWRASGLEEKLSAANAQLQAQQQYVTQLEATQAKAVEANKEWASYAGQLEVKLKAAATVEDTIRRIGVREAAGFNAYYVKAGETVQSVAKKVTGDATNHRIILLDNKFEEKDIVPGRLLWIRKSHTLSGAEGVYSRVPDISAVLLYPQTSINEHFSFNQAKVQETVHLNRRLGLNYDENSEGGYRLVYTF